MKFNLFGGWRVDRKRGKEPSIYKCKLPKQKSILMKEKVSVSIHKIITLLYNRKKGFYMNIWYISKIYNIYQAIFLICKKYSHDTNSCAVWKAKNAHQPPYLRIRANTEAWEIVRGSEAKADIREIAGSSIYRIVHTAQEIELAGATILITRKLRLDPKDRKYLAVFKQKKWHD